MSYEGYEQHICEEGHYFTVPCSYMFDQRIQMCPNHNCGAKSAWVNHVDDTNCDQSGYIPVQLLKCKQWGKFAIPTSEEAKKMMTLRHDLKGLVYYEEVNYDDLRMVVFPEYKICDYRVRDVCTRAFITNNIRDTCRASQDNLCT